MPTGKNVLLISLGSIGQRHLRNTRELLPNANIAVYRQHVKDSSDVPEGANALFHSLGDALAFDPEAVIISSPASEHINNAEAFLEIGSHQFIEKPLAVNSKDLDSFVH